MVAWAMTAIMQTASTSSNGPSGFFVFISVELFSAFQFVQQFFQFLPARLQSFFHGELVQPINSKHRSPRQSPEQKQHFKQQNKIFAAPATARPARHSPHSSKKQHYRHKNWQQIPPENIFQQPDLMADFRERSGRAIFQRAVQIRRLFLLPPTVNHEICTDHEAAEGAEMQRPIWLSTAIAMKTGTSTAATPTSLTSRQKIIRTEMLLVAAHLVQQHVGVDGHFFRRRPATATTFENRQGS